MKKNLILVGVMLLGILGMAQEKSSELRVSYGLGTAQQFVDSFSDAFVSGITGNSFQTSNEHSSGVFAVDYLYAISQKVSLTGTYAFERMTKDVQIAGKPEGKQKDNYHILMVGGDYNYINKNKWKLYSSVSVGAFLDNQTIKGESENEINFAFHIAPIGFRYGEDLGVFASFGYGFKGLVNVGISYTF